MDKRGIIMAIVITNGTYFIRYDINTGATKKTTDINLAYKFATAKDAIDGMRQARGKTKKFYVYDTNTQYIIWRWMTEEEKAEAKKNKFALTMVKRDKSGKIKRKSYPESTRKLIYLNANGKCELCGRSILMEDMTIDHVNPLSLGGEDDVENLACTCFSCNMFKGNILPDDFMERITEIFMYQMEKNIQGKIKRWVICKLLQSIK